MPGILSNFTGSTVFSGTNSNHHSSPSFQGGAICTAVAADFQLDSSFSEQTQFQCEENVATLFFPHALSSSVAPPPAHICARFYPFNLFLPIIPFLPQRRPRTPPPPSLTPLSHVFSTLSACVDDPSKCIVCPFMYCIFYSPAELLSCFFKIDFKIDLRRSHFIGLQKGCKHILLKLSLSPKNSFSTFI